MNLFKKRWPALSFAENFLGGHVTLGAGNDLRRERHALGRGDSATRRLPILPPAAALLRWLVAAVLLFLAGRHADKRNALVLGQEGARVLVARRRERSEQISGSDLIEASTE